MKKINIFPFLVRDGLVHVGLYGISRGSELAGLFELLKERDARLKFLSQINWNPETMDLSFCIEEEAFANVQRELKELARELGAREMEVKKPAAVIRILGPHLDLRPRMSALIYDALVEEEIDVIANSTTITTCLLVIHEEKTEAALRSLRKFFRDTVKKR